MRSTAALCVGVFFLTFAGIARADEVEVSVSSEFSVSFEASNDNYLPLYSTAYAHTVAYTSLGENYFVGVMSPSFSLSLPAGSVVQEAAVFVQVPSQTFTGTGTLEW